MLFKVFVLISVLIATACSKRADDAASGVDSEDPADALQLTPGTLSINNSDLQQAWFKFKGTGRECDVAKISVGRFIGNDFRSPDGASLYDGDGQLLHTARRIGGPYLLYRSLKKSEWIYLRISNRTGLDRVEVKFEVIEDCRLKDNTPHYEYMEHRQVSFYDRYYTYFLPGCRRYEGICYTLRPGVSHWRQYHITQSPLHIFLHGDTGQSFFMRIYNLDGEIIFQKSDIVRAPGDHDVGVEIDSPELKSARDTPMNIIWEVGADSLDHEIYNFSLSYSGSRPPSQSDDSGTPGGGGSGTYIGCKAHSCNGICVQRGYTRGEIGRSCQFTEGGVTFNGNTCSCYRN